MPLPFDAKNKLLFPCHTGRGDHHAGEGKQGQSVGNDHQVIEHIGQFPHKVVGHERAQEDKHEGQDRIDLGRLLA